MDEHLRDEPTAWPVDSSTDHYRTDWVMAFREDLIRRPDGVGGSFGRLVLEHPGAVVVLALDDEQRVCCLRQYRHPAQRTFVELPAGLLDAVDEDPVEAAKRELREEVQLSAATWTPLLSTYSSPGITSELLHYYLATDLTPADRGDFELHHEEIDIEPFWVPYADLLAAVLDGRLQDAPVALAVLAVKERGLLG
ncbi:MAG: NUDIX hydrolase [Nocardioides sp.]